MQTYSLIPARLSRFLAIASLTLLAMSAFAAPPWQGHEGQEDGILTIYNPAEPMNEPSVIKPEPQWRIGSEESDADILFGLVTDAQRTPDGRTYILDAVLSTVYEVANDGEVLRTLGKEGDGPGEFRNATSLALMPDLSIGIVELMPSHMDILGQDGLPQPGIDLKDGEGGRTHVQRLTVVDDTIVMSMLGMNFSDGGVVISNTLGTFDMEGNLKHKVLHASEKQTGMSISISAGEDFDFTNNWVVGADGQVVVYQRTHDYLLELFDADGKATKRIRREYKSVRRPDEEIEEQREQRREMAERFGTDRDSDIDEMARDISEVVARPNGELWVISGEGRQSCPEGHLGTFDVYDSNGRFVRQTSIEADYDPDADNFVIRGNHLYIFKEALNAPPRTMTGGGGGMRMVMTSGGGSSDDDEDDDGEMLPFEVICYVLPTDD